MKTFWVRFKNFFWNKRKEKRLLDEQERIEYLTIEAYWLEKASLRNDKFRQDHRNMILEQPSSREKEEEAAYASCDKRLIRPYEVKCILWEFVSFWPYEPENLANSYWKFKALNEITDKLTQLYGVMICDPFNNTPEPFLSSLSYRGRNSYFEFMLSFHRRPLEPDYNQLRSKIEKAMRELVVCVDNVRIIDVWPFRYLILFIKLIKIYIETIDTIEKDLRQY